MGPGEGRRRGTLVRLVVAPLVLLAVAAVAWSQIATGSALGTDLLLLLSGGLAGFELASMLRGTAPGTDRLLPTLACALLSGVGLLAPQGLEARNAVRLAIVVGALLVLLARHARDLGPEAVERIGRALIPVLYVGLLFTWMAELAHGAEGGETLLWVLLVSKASDMGGWLVGKPWGRHKLVPRVSPGKSWEGLAGGLVASALMAWLMPEPLGVHQVEAWGVAQRVLFGVALALASVAAGITHSAWKRRLGAKDSSQLIPEMGGVLDMIDSLLFAGPLGWLWLTWA